jgi:glycosyltransferase involved in cell wall biosynthesis
VLVQGEMGILDDRDSQLSKRTGLRGVRTVLIVGPSRAGRGGIASFIRMMAGMSLPSAYHLEFFETTSERVGGRVIEALGVPIRFLVAVMLHRPSLVHIHTSQAGSFLRKATVAAMCRGMGLPYILHVHGSTFDHWASVGGRVRRWAVGRTLTGAAVVVALSESWRSRLEALSPSARVTVVHNGVLVPSEPSSRAEPTTVVFLGRLSQRKGVDLITQAVRCTQEKGVDAVWVLAGDGDREQVIAERNSLPYPDRVLVPGWMGPEERAALLSRASVFVLPSRDEGLPLSMLEAMSYGLTCVVSSVGGIPEVIINRVNGLLVDPLDVERLVAAVELAVCDAELSRVLGAEARRTVLAGFSSECVALGLERVYGEVLGGG